jgi:hypothetical protein
MKTSCYKHYKKADGVAISIYPPEGFRGKHYPKLAPTKKALDRYRKDGNKKAYIKSYEKDVLSKLNPEQVWEELKDNTILCYEPSGEFCHRHLVAEWFERELDEFVMIYEV